MLALALALSLSAAPAAPLKVLVLDLRADGAPDAVARLVRDEVTVSLGRDKRLDVLSSEDLRRAVAVQGEQAALGCDTAKADSCLAEIGQALGARYIVHGSIGVLGGNTIVHL